MRVTAAAIVVLGSFFVAIAGASTASFPAPGTVVYSAATPSLGRGSHSLFTARTDGTARVQVTGGPDWDYAPRWSPDGKQIAFTRYDGDQTTVVWVANADGTGARQLSTGGYGELPEWSPDGRWIAYQEQTDYGSRGARGDPTFNLWIARPDGTTRRKVASGGAYGSSADFIGTGAGWSWSPGSKRIAFVYPEPSLGVDPYTTGPRLAIGIVNIATGKRRLLAAGTQPAWSPDGLLLAVGTGDLSGSERSRGVWQVSTQGGKRRLLVRPQTDSHGETVAFDGTPLWSPDGRAIAFTRFGDNGSSLYLVTPDGQTLLRVPAGTAATASWPRDCSHLFFYNSVAAEPPSEDQARKTGWILPGGNGKPRFVRLPTGIDADWHC